MHLEPELDDEFRAFIIFIRHQCDVFSSLSLHDHSALYSDKNTYKHSAPILPHPFQLLIQSTLNIWNTTSDLSISWSQPRPQRIIPWMLIPWRLAQPKRRKPGVPPNSLLFLLRFRLFCLHFRLLFLVWWWCVSFLTNQKGHHTG